MTWTFGDVLYIREPAPEDVGLRVMVVGPAGGGDIKVFGLADPNTPGRPWTGTLQTIDPTKIWAHA